MRRAARICARCVIRPCAPLRIAGAAGNRQIVAVGTQFDVRLDRHSVRVTLLEGKVRIKPAQSGRQPGRAAGYASAPQTTNATDQAPDDADSVLLIPGEQLLAEVDG